MSETKRKIFSGEFKAKVALEAIRGINSLPIKWSLEFGIGEIFVWKLLLAIATSKVQILTLD